MNRKNDTLQRILDAGGALMAGCDRSWDFPGLRYSAIAIVGVRGGLTVYLRGVRYTGWQARRELDWIGDDLRAQKAAQERAQDRVDEFRALPTVVPASGRPGTVGAMLSEAAEKGERAVIQRLDSIADMGTDTVLWGS